MLMTIQYLSLEIVSFEIEVDDIKISHKLTHSSINIVVISSLNVLIGNINR